MKKLILPGMRNTLQGASYIDPPLAGYTQRIDKFFFITKPEIQQTSGVYSHDYLARWELKDGSKGEVTLKCNQADMIQLIKLLDPEIVFFERLGEP